jgi:hypothetical protein
MPAAAAILVSASSGQEHNRGDATAAVAALLAIFATSFATSTALSNADETPMRRSLSLPTEPDANLPFYTRAEVSKHKTRETRIWVTYKTGEQIARGMQLWMPVVRSLGVVKRLDAWRAAATIAVRFL